MSASMAENGNAETEMFTKAEVEELIQKTLTHFRAEMDSMLNSKLKAFQDRQKELEEKAESLEMDLELHKESTERIMNKMHKSIDHLQEHYNTLERKLKNVTVRANDIEQYSRRNHLRFWGVKLNPKESALDAVLRVVNTQLLIKGSDGQRLPLTPQHIEVAHCLRMPASAKAGDPAPIIVRFFNRNVRDRIIAARRQLKKTSNESTISTPKISISEDLTGQNQKLITELRKCPSVDNSWSWNGKVYYILKDKDEERHQFHLFDDLPE